MHLLSVYAIAIDTRNYCSTDETYANRVFLFKKLTHILKRFHFNFFHSIISKIPDVFQK